MTDNLDGNHQVKIFESDNIWSAILRMVVPALAAILVMLVYNMADMIFVGQTGETAQVAAVSVVGPVFNMIMSVAMLISGGGAVLISRDIGAKDYEHAKMVSSLCVWGAILFGILSGVLIIAANKPLLLFLGATKDIETYARQYMIILAFGAPFLMITSMLGQILRAEGAVKQGLAGNVIGTVLNLVLDPIFILFFHMGVVGAAIATVIGNFVATLYYAYYIKHKAVVINADPAYALKNAVYLFAVMGIGLPNAVSTLLSGLANSFGNQLLSKYGSDAIAANAAAGKVNMIITMILMGICMGAQPLLSYNYGAGNMRKLAGVIQRLIILFVNAGVIMAGLVIVLKKPVISLFLKDTAVAVMAEQILSIVMISSPFMGFFYLATNFLQAVGHAAKATLISSLQKGILLIPALFLFEWILGYVGIRMAYVVADFMAIIFSSLVMLIEWKELSHATEGKKDKNGG